MFPAFARSADRAISLVTLLDGAQIESAAGAGISPSQIGPDDAPAPGILANAPSSIRFTDLPIPRHALLELSVGMPGPRTSPFTPPIPQLAPRQAPVRFTVSAVVGGQRQVLWDQRFEWSHEWHPATIDLSSLGGSTIDLVFETRADQGVAAAGWAGVRLRAPEIAPLPRWVRRTIADLLTSPDRRDAGSVPGVPRPQGPIQRTVDVPEAAVLVLEAGATPDPRRTGDQRTTFQAWIGGQLVLDQDTLASGFAGLHREIPVPAGRGVEICLLTMSESYPPGAWRTARVETRRPAPSAGSGPSVLLLICDTLRADRLGAYGNPLPTSPHFDRLSRRSELFERAMSQAPWTLPSMTSLFTGRYPAVAADPTEFAAMAGIAHSDVTLAERCQDAGVETAAFVANPLLDDRTGFPRGFETYVAFSYASAHAVRTLFSDWLDGARQHRWLAYLHDMEPHEPYEPTRPAWTLIGTGQPMEDVSAWSRSLKTRGAPEPPGPIVTQLRRSYEAELPTWDAEIGQLRADLASRRLDRDLVMIVAGDHGEEILDHGLLGHGMQLYEESLHVPLLVHGRAAAALRSTLVELRSVRALLLSACGARVEAASPEPGAGIALLGGGLAPAPGSGRIYGSATYEDERWKYIENGRTGSHELFDLAADPGEAHNLAGIETGEASECQTRLQKAIAGPAPPPAPPAEDEIEKLRALGYVQ
ncbi:MAG: sulfatase [Acidobacteriota bacterium]